MTREKKLLLLSGILLIISSLIRLYISISHILTSREEAD